MLDDHQINWISKQFGVYDQEWRFYSGFLGEPFLISDYLVYYDGRIVYICAFCLSDLNQRISTDEISQIVMHFASSDVQGINVWGQLADSPHELRFPRGTAALLNADEDGEEHTGEYLINIAEFDYSRYPKARKGMRRAQRAGVSARVVTQEYLSSAHISLLRKFFATHQISIVHAGCYLSIQQLLRDPRTRVIESYADDILVGFKMFVISSETHATSICGFYDTTKVHGASDLSMATCIEYCRDNGIDWLHLGYSGSESLGAFKRKWGATASGPAYGEAFYYFDNQTRTLFETSRFLWRDTLMLDVLDNRVK